MTGPAHHPQVVAAVRRPCPTIGKISAPAPSWSGAGSSAAAAPSCRLRLVLPLPCGRPTCSTSVVAISVPTNSTSVRHAAWQEVKDDVREAVNAIPVVVAEVRRVPQRLYYNSTRLLDFQSSSLL